MRKADHVAQRLLRRIVAGELEVGELLPKEDELASSFDVNRSVIREAVKLLEVHRLVRPVRRRGTAVLDPMESISPEVVAAMLMPTVATIDLDVLRDLLEIRAELDVQMTALAAERRSTEDLANLEGLVADLGTLVDDPPAYVARFEDFTRVIVRATGNRLYLMLFHWHQRIQRELGDLLVSVRQPSAAHFEGLKMLLDQIRKQDVEGVRALVTVFHQWATPRILTLAALKNGTPLHEVALSASS